MIKVKILESDDVHRLEASINNFIHKNQYIIVQEIKFNSYGNGEINGHTAMIIYKDN